MSTVANASTFAAKLFMKRDISHEQFYIIPLLFFFIGLSICTIIMILFFNEYTHTSKIVSIVVLLLTTFIGWYFSMRLYKVAFDSDFLYLSRFGRTQKIGLEKVDNISPGIFPIKIFYLRSYIVTIIYLENENKKKIRFISKGAFRKVGSIKGISHLEKLRQYILDKKHGRLQ